MRVQLRMIDDQSHGEFPQIVMCCALCGVPMGTMESRSYRLFHPLGDCNHSGQTAPLPEFNL